jgi:hypothetical protein
VRPTTSTACADKGIVCRPQTCVLSGCRWIPLMKPVSAGQCGNNVA